MRGGMRDITVLLLFFCVLLLTAPSQAGIYRYEDDNGVIHFTNCPRDSKFKLYIKESKEDVEGGTPLPIRGAKDSNRFDHLISEFSGKYQVDFALIKAMIRAESGFNPYAVSRRGAKGLMQLMPGTALRMNVVDVYNPKENIDGGVRYIKYLLSLLIMTCGFPWPPTMQARTSSPSCERSLRTGKQWTISEKFRVIISPTSVNAQWRNFPPILNLQITNSTLK
jgi:hypothetical protein